MRCKPRSTCLSGTSMSRPSSFPLVEIGMVHYQFETIRPFLDGNGRLGRLLIAFLLVERALLPQPLLYLSDHTEPAR
ncbi:MAG: Fic family protein [Acidimicrobiaceae bacterium]|nr:Fic family protein [Acidimicrobiaceae bacterium]MYJ42964.1 Fic family protein [Acidimicrobiaceae bacterium]